MARSPDDLIADSKVAAVVTNPRLPDNPIIACNDAFVALTGYAREAIVGRNCRFLRGERTEPEQTARLRDAVARHQPAMVELVNYRKDGTAFRNAVMIAPLFGEDGGLLYFLGSQIAVEHGAESRSERARAKLAGLTPRQRQILEALAKGLLNKQIAFELGLTERTVKMHRAATLRALGARTLADAIRLAIEAGL